MDSNQYQQKYKNQTKQPPIQFNSNGNKKGSHISRQQLKLQSCQKIKHIYIHDKTHHTSHPIKNHQNDDKNLLTFGVTNQFKFKRQTERLINLLISICELNSQTSEKLNNAKQMINDFGNQIQLLFDKYLQQFSALSLNKQQKQQFNKKILLYIDDTLKRQFVLTEEQLKDKSIRIKEWNNSNDGSDSFTLKKSHLYSPIANLHQQKEKNSISKIQSSFNEVNKLLDKVIQPRFIRKSKLLTKNSRGNSSSFQEVMQRSLQERKKQNSNGSNSKQTLYTLSRLLNQ